MNWLFYVYHKCPIIIIHRHSFFEAFVWDICSSIRTMPGASFVTAIRWRFGSSRRWTIILTRTPFNWDVMMLKILKSMYEKCLSHMKSHEVTLNRLKKRIGSKIAMIAMVAIHDRHLIGIHWGVCYSRYPTRRKTFECYRTSFSGFILYIWII